MRRLLLFFFCLLALGFIPGARSQENKDFKHFISHNMISSLLNLKCVNYFYFSRKYLGQCTSTVNSLTKIMDYYHPLLSNPGGVLFLNKLTALWENEQTHIYFSSLLESVESLHQGLLKEFNLWEFTLGFWKDKDSALEVLAVMFQDTSEDNAQLHFLEMFYSDSTSYERFFVFKKVLSFFNSSFLREQEYQIELYPKDLGYTTKQLGFSLYYFYVNTYLTLKIKENTFAKVMPLLLSSLYKFHRITNSYGRWLTSPKKIDLEKHRYSLTSLFSTYLGAHWISNQCQEMDSLESFLKKFAASPKLYLKLLFYRQTSGQESD